MTPYRFVLRAPKATRLEEPAPELGEGTLQSPRPATPIWNILRHAMLRIAAQDEAEGVRRPCWRLSPMLATQPKSGYSAAR